MVQISKDLAEKPYGSLPRNIETNPREHCKVITLRNGKTLEPLPKEYKTNLVTELPPENMVEVHTPIDDDSSKSE